MRGRHWYTETPSVLVVSLLAFLLTLIWQWWSYQAQPAIYIVGDSTASRHARQDPPIAGWGEMLPGLLPPGVRVVNAAVPGRSSRSFYHQHWPAIVSDLRPGDWVLIQFAHNDHSRDPERHTDPEGSFRQFLQQYIQETQQAGARVVLVTPIQRRVFANGKLTPYFADYVQAMRRLAMEEQLPLIDLWQQTGELFQHLGEEGTRPLFMQAKVGKPMDNTHLSPEGAAQVAGLLAKPLQEIMARSGTTP